jgi:staphylococcal nuclease domain-containing protein 1
VAILAISDVDATCKIARFKILQNAKLKPDGFPAQVRACCLGLAATNKAQGDRYVQLRGEGVYPAIAALILVPVHPLINPSQLALYSAAHRCRQLHSCLFWPVTRPRPPQRFNAKPHQPAMPAPVGGAASGPAPASRPPFRVALPAIVKAVPSGDTLVLIKAGPSPNGPPPELRLGLGSVRAPALGRADGESPDEPGAFAAREALRRMCIGKRVTFEIEYEVKNLGGRLMGRVCVVAGEAGAAPGVALAVQMVKMGLVKVRRVEGGKEEVSDDYEALCAAEDEAVQARAGLHGDVAALPARKIVTAPVDGNTVAEACKGASMNGVVEYISNGGAMKCFVPAVPGGLGDRVFTFCLSGVQCPSFKREGDVVKPMPYALNAKYVTETRLLHRDVDISVEGCDRNGVLFATILEKGDPKSEYIGEELLRRGYAKTVSWSIELTKFGGRLRATERVARDSGIGVWKGFVKKEAADGVFVGQCVEVVSGDMVAVQDSATGEVQRICLASVRAARGETTRDRSAMVTGPAHDAKEALRKKLIGRKVKVSVAYTKEPAEGSVRKDNMVFAVIGREGDTKTEDVALPLVSDGLVSVVRHRGEEERSPNYEAYLEREKVAMEAQRGVHKSADGAASMMRINNLTGPDARKRSKDVAPGLIRSNPHRGVVEYLSSASRMRVFLPKQAMLITIGLKAVRTPAPSRKTFLPDGTARLESKEEPHGDEALSFARAAFMQRDVEVVIAAVDKVGAFLGNVYIVNSKGEKTDVSKTLLDAGMGYLHESFDPRETGGGPLKIAEANARGGKVGLWKDYEEPAVAESSASAGLAEKPIKTVSGSVCEVGFGGRIFVQGAESTGTIKAVETGLARLKLDAGTAPPVGSFKASETVAAKFSADGLWYRAKILTRTPDGARVRFIDYGNEETVNAKDIRRPEGGGAVTFMSKVPAATEVHLADIVVPEANESCGYEAGQVIRDLVFGKQVEVLVRGTERGVVIGDVTVSAGSGSGAASTAGGSAGSGSISASPTNAAAQKVSVVEKLLESGMARIVRKSDRTSKAAYNRLAEFEKTGQATRDGLWIYGECVDSDEDDEPEVRERNASRRGF